MSSLLDRALDPGPEGIDPQDVYGDVFMRADLAESREVSAHEHIAVDVLWVDSFRPGVERPIEQAAHRIARAQQEKVADLRDADVFGEPELLVSVLLLLDVTPLKRSHLRAVGKANAPASAALNRLQAR